MISHQRSVTHDSLRYINILTYLLTYLCVPHGSQMISSCPSVTHFVGNQPQVDRSRSNWTISKRTVQTWR